MRDTNSYISLLPWDTNFFGYKIGKINYTFHSSSKLLEILSQAKKEKYALLYCFIDPMDTTANSLVRKEKALLVDQKVTFIKSLSKQDDSLVSSKIISYLKKPLNNQLLTLALQSGEYSRYKIDPHFTHQEYEKLYNEWIRKSLSGEIADEVFVFLDEKQENGLITLTHKQQRADIGLLVVDRNARGKSIGTKLIQAAFQWAKGRNYQEIQVITQENNKIACTFYEKVGFTKENIANVYHFWFN